MTTDATSRLEAQADSGSGRNVPQDAQIVIPVRNIVLFPGLVFPITIGRPISIAAAEQAVREQRQVVILLQRNPDAETPEPGDLYRVGTLANVLRYVTGGEAGNHLICQGVQRFQITDFVAGWPFIVSRGLHLPEPASTDLTSEVEARFQLLKQQALEALELIPQTPPELVATVRAQTSAVALTDMVAAYMDISAAEKQEVLEATDLRQRMEMVSKRLAHRIEVMRLSANIAEQTKASLDKRQREMLLREQLATIQRELGEEDGQAREIADLEKAIADAKMPDEAEKQARKELRRLQRMPEASAEYGMVRTYLDWLIELPWVLSDSAPIDIAEARRVLDEEHYGLDKIKTRIVEYLAVRKLAPAGKAPILCFVGPPGVGKTSLGQSIAHAMKRKFVRVSLGGLHDEAEIRGHRRTYVGALPGNIVQALRRAGSRDCVMMLDEIDKMGVGLHGDPSAALLEVLDPEQNNSFRDNYLGVPFDLSAVVFITTANMLDTIPAPLRDRMEIIALAGYTSGEKLEIARRFLVPRQLEANGLKAEQVDVDDEALRDIISSYTREAGVRNLEREIGRVFRHAAVEIAEGAAQHVHIGGADVRARLGPPRFEDEVASRTRVPGVATGLAWTPVGGEILFIEATRSEGDGRLILTGQLGDVMKESVQAALTLVKNMAAPLKLDPAAIRKSDVHVHVPAGATPKDGPSAGVAMFMALASLFTGCTVRNDTAMTGEISLRGLVLPVGGIKEKVVAAAGAGIKRVMMPARNKRDLEEIPEEARRKLEFIWLERVEDAISGALECESDVMRALEKTG